MNDWHVWTVIDNRRKRIVKFLSELNGVEDFLYPTAEKECNTKCGKRIKDVPIYANYIFIKYDHNPLMTDAIGQCPWISYYVGKCTADEICKVHEQNKKSYDELVPVEQLKEGSTVKLVNTPFAGWEAVVINISGDKLSVSISILGAERVIKCNMDDVNIQ